MASRAADLERQFAQYVGAAHAVSFASARAAFGIALEAVGLSPGDEVITSVGAPTVAAEAIQDVGGRPVLLDVQTRMLTLDPEQIAPQVSARTRIVLPVHVAGVPCDMGPILEVAALNGLRVVEDGREALGATYRGRRVGTIGDVTVMMPDGQATTAVILTTDRAEYAAWFRRRRRRLVPAVGHVRVSHATPPSAAAVNTGLTMLEQAERLRRIRSYYAELYRLGLADVDELLPPSRPPYGDPAYHAFIVHLQLQQLTLGHRDEFVALLRRRLVAAEPGFVALVARPRFGGLGSLEDFPRARAAQAAAVALPLDPGMTEAMVWRAIAATRQAVAAHGPGADRAG